MLVLSSESSRAPYSALNVVVSVTLVVSPALVASVAAPSTSLLPIQTVTKVGSTRCNAWSCVCPPRKKDVSGLGCDAGAFRLSSKLYA